MRFATFVLTFAVLTLGSQTLAQEPTVAAPASAAENPASDPPTKEPNFCPLFELLVMSGGTMYYCDLFVEDCCGEPQATYGFGEYDYPCSCCGVTEHCCPPSKHLKSLLGCPFPGLVKPVPDGYVHQMPAGRARENSKVQSFTHLPYIKFPLGTSVVYAQVFEISLDIDGARGGIPTGNYTRKIYVAFETTERPTSAKELDKDDIEHLGPATPAGKQYVHKTTLIANDQAIQVLIMTVRKAGDEVPPCKRCAKCDEKPEPPSK